MWYQQQWCQGCSQTREVKRRAGEALQAEEEKEDGQLDGRESPEAMEMFYKQMVLIKEAGNCPETRTKEESSQHRAHKRKRRGGKGSRLRRLLVHQLLLTEGQGLPLSRLLGLKGNEAKSQRKGREEQEESQRQGGV